MAVMRVQNLSDQGFVTLSQTLTDITVKHFPKTVFIFFPWRIKDGLRKAKDRHFSFSVSEVLGQILERILCDGLYDVFVLELE